MNEYDWRADMSEIDNLYDCDPVQLLIFLRHQYLLCAKDMLDDDWDGLGNEVCEVVESLQAAIEAQVGNLDVTNCT